MQYPEPYPLLRLLAVSSLLFWTHCSSPVNETSEGIGSDGLRVSHFQVEEAQQITTAAGIPLKCNLYLKYSEEDSGYILVVSFPPEESSGLEFSFMKINGEWVRFNGILEQVNFHLNLWSDQVSSDYMLYIYQSHSGSSLEESNFSLKLKDLSTEQHIDLDLASQDTDC